MAINNESHYSLRWNNHQSHILSSFEALLHAEALVDVTLVCAGTSVRAHKVVLSACSPFFQKIFSENPCKHPVIVLKDFNGWEIQSMVDFMYKGEISVGREQLPSLIKAAESLQIRGLDDIGTSTNIQKESQNNNQSPAPSTSPNDYDRNFYQNARFAAAGTPMRSAAERSSPFSPLPGHNYDHHMKLPHMTHLSFPESLIPRPEQQRTDCQSPLPRRKQARPRRRSGELCTAQDLSTSIQNKPQSPMEETAENLCVKKTKEEKKEHREQSKTPETTGSPELDLSMTSKDFTTSPPLMQPLMGMKPDLENHLAFPPMPNVSALTMSQPHSKFFGLDATLGLFPPGLDGCRNPLLEMADPRSTESPLYVKKKMGRPKGQHSAPRGGPPRSWTNAELTEALQHVWNKKMTTSQASRIFGIPYNSLLMYVRGKYGKSLKLEQLRKDCIGAPGTPMDMMSSMAGNNNNNSLKNERDEAMQPNTRPNSTEEMSNQHMPQQSIFNPFTQSFFPEYSASFPIPVNMVHLLPQSEKNREHYRQQSLEDDRNDRVKDEPQDMFMPSSLSLEDRRELVQQNGQD